MTEIRPWYVDSDPDHPANPNTVAEPQPAVAQVLEIPPHVVEAAQIAESPTVSAEEREVALNVLRAWDAEHAPVSDVHPSTIPDDLIPAQYQAGGSDVDQH